MYPLIVLLGPTASGKTKLAANLAAAIDAEIISADSRQVYKRMNIGTGKDYSDYIVHNKQIPTHLIDIREPGEAYNVAEFLDDFETANQDITQRGKPSILCGGTGFYISGVLEGYEFTQVPPNYSLRRELELLSKEELVKQLQQYPPQGKVDTASKKRIIRAIEIAQHVLQFGTIDTGEKKDRSYKIFGLDLPREIRRARISTRLRDRLEEGLVEEVRNLLKEGISSDQLKYYGLEYKFTCEFLEEMYSFEEYVERLEVAIHQYAKRQMTWFRKMEKDGHHIEWLNALDAPEANVKRVVESLNSKS